MAPIRVVLVDNQEACLLGMRAAIERHPERFQIVGVAQAIEQVDLAATPCDVVVLDLMLGHDDQNATPAIPGLLAQGAQVLIHTSEERPVPLRQAIAAGAGGMCLKNDGLGPLLAAIEAIAAGELVWSSQFARALATDPDAAAALSPTGLAVLTALGQGLTRKEVAAHLNIKLTTVSEHIGRARDKYLSLGRTISNTQSLVRELQRDGWVERY